MENTSSSPENVPADGAIVDAVRGLLIAEAVDDMLALRETGRKAALVAAALAADVAAKAPPPDPLKGLSRDQLVVRRDALRGQIDASARVLERSLIRTSSLGYGQRVARQGRRLRFLGVARQDLRMIERRLERSSS